MTKSKACEARTGNSKPRWNAISEKVQKQVLDLALERTDLSPRALACRYTDENRYFVSESSVCRIWRAADLITSPAPRLPSGASRRLGFPRESWVSLLVHSTEFAS